MALIHEEAQHNHNPATESTEENKSGHEGMARLKTLFQEPVASGCCAGKSPPRAVSLQKQRTTEEVLILGSLNCRRTGVREQKTAARG